LLLEFLPNFFSTKKNKKAHSLYSSSHFQNIIINNLNYIKLHPSPLPARPPPPARAMGG
jgi:hypothetical protein